MGQFDNFNNITFPSIFFDLIRRCTSKLCRQKFDISLGVESLSFLLEIHLNDFR